MYRLYYYFNLVNKYTEYYLINNTELEFFNEIKFRYLLSDANYQIKVYKEHNINIPAEYIIEERNAGQCKIAEYNQFLDLYNIIQIRFVITSTKVKLELKSDLDLMLLNWDIN